MQYHVKKLPKQYGETTSSKTAAADNDDSDNVDLFASDEEDAPKPKMVKPKEKKQKQKEEVQSVNSTCTHCTIQNTFELLLRFCRVGSR